MGNQGNCGVVEKTRGGDLVGEFEGGEELQKDLFVIY